MRKKLLSVALCATMVAGMSATCVMAADDMPEQFKDLKAAEAYEFPMMVKSFKERQSKLRFKGFSLLVKL